MRYAQSCRRVGTYGIRVNGHRSGAIEDTEGMKRLVAGADQRQTAEGHSTGSLWQDC